METKMSEQKRDDGGPVHPDSGRNLTRGITLRDYFIAHAPEPQSWFEPDMPTRRPAPLWKENNSDRIFKSPNEAEKAVGFDGYHNAYHDAAEEWDYEKKKQRYIQWPAAWADKM